MENLTASSQVSAREFDPRRFVDTMHQTQSELKRHLNEIITRAQSILVGAGDQPVSNAEVQTMARTVRQVAEQSLEILNNRYLIPTTPTKAAISEESTNSLDAKTISKPELLVVDDNSVNRELLARRLELQGYRISRAENGRLALDMLHAQPFDLVLLDIMMPEIDGYEVLKIMKGDESLRHIPIIMISALGDLDSIVRCIEVGAEDYLPKPFNSTLLVARVEACLEKKRLRDQERLTYQALVRSQQQLAGELAEAAGYVRSILPAPMEEKGIKTDWLFIPSTQLGGDSFGYYWIDEDNFALFLLDVCGHGVGAALLSISVVNVLRSQSLPETDFLNPSAVLKGLNEAFPMEKQNNMYFTIWYGVFNKKTRELSYAIGGHPHAVVLSGETEAQAKPIELGSPGLLIGGMPGITYKTHTAKLGAFAKVILFSDGVCEATSPEGVQWDYEQFLSLLTVYTPEVKSELHRVLTEAQQIVQGESFDDDFSMVKFLF